MITQEYLKAMFDYEDGVLYWKTKPNRRIKIGDAVGYINNRGYLSTKIEKKTLLVHRLIFMWHHGIFPKFIDHKDRNKNNNRIDNLRSVSHAENMRNRKDSKIFLTT
jgi:hypothetical protein